MNPVYVFLHLRKTAGSTLKYHLRKNFRPGEIIFINPKSDTHVSVYFEDWQKEMTREELAAYLGGLPQNKKDRLRMIFGHRVYSGIHEPLGRPARYITFLRNPETRTLSHYNWYLEKKIRQNGSSTKARLTDDHFRAWLQAPESPDNFMTRVLIESFQSKPSTKRELASNDLERAKTLLKSFYFVGITEQYDRDAAFLYEQFSIIRFFSNQKISTKYYVPEDREAVAKLIRDKCWIDCDLYAYANHLNQRFREANKEFARCVGQARRVKRVAARMGTVMRCAGTLKRLPYAVLPERTKRREAYDEICQQIRDAVKRVFFRKLARRESR
ncbi:MAG: sulfotransferase family 2 domain-containing protein [Candidatus Omnitrophota bacterium]|nr:sulfotransferase family 2 domain-containing protein [Candidatus Omnitrophota bacterium]